MSLHMRAALSLVLSVAAAGHQAEGVCPNNTYPSMRAVTGISEACFEKCPQLCQPVSDLVKQYFEDGNHVALRLRVCISPDRFDCLYAKESVEDCSKLLGAAHNIGLDLPSTKAALDEQCAPNPEGQVACSSPMSPSARTVTDLSPECFAGCPETCTSVDKLVSQYTQGANYTALESEVCAAREQFSCFYKHGNADACRKVWTAGSVIGLGFPKSMEELNQRCLSQDAPQRRHQANHSSGEHAVCDGTEDSMMQVVTNFSSRCFEACPQACKPMERLVGDYRQNKSAQVLIDRVCRHQEAFECFYRPENLGECRKVLEAGRRLGVLAPQTKEELNVACKAEIEGEKICPQARNPTIHMVTRLSSKCFKLCHKMCSPVDELVTEYVKDGKAREKRMKEVLCSHERSFKCMFKEDHLHECSKVLQGSPRLNMSLPQSEKELEDLCRGVHKARAHAPNSTERAKRHNETKPVNESGAVPRHTPVPVPAVGNNTALENSTVQHANTTSHVSANHTERTEPAASPATTGAGPGRALAPDWEMLDSVLEEGADPGKAGVCPGRSAMLQAVTNISVACFANCSQACKVLDHAVRDYMHNRTAHALVDRVCRHQDQLACFYKPENLNECSKVFDAAKQVGILVPKTLKELEGTCQEQAQDGGICPKARNPTLNAVTRLSPECFHLCPKLCKPMEQLVTEYVMHGNTTKLQELVCKEERRFKCMYEVNNTRECGKVVKAGTLLNITLPRTMHQLKEGCRAFHEGKGGSESKAPPRRNATENPGNKTNVSWPATEASTPNLMVKVDTDPSAAELEGVETSAGVCLPGKTALLHAVTDIAPPCVEACPNLCGSLDNILAQYTLGKAADQESIQSQVCARAASFSCVFQGDNFQKCKKVLEASSAVGARVPLTEAEYRSACATGLRGANDLPQNTIVPHTPAPRLLQAAIVTDKGLSSSAQAASIGIAAVAILAAAVV